jgi:hypothetical protein
MPLSPSPFDRELRHHRTIHCEGYRRRDGLWDIEGRLTDTKTHPVPNHHQETIAAGAPIHGMFLRLTVDLDLVIHAVEAVSDAVPNPECREVTDRFQLLVGLRIAPGFTRAVHDRLGGTRGCTHLVELLKALATAAFQSVYLEREQKLANDAGRERPHLVDSCHTLRSDGPVIQRRWPQFYTGPASEPTPEDSTG